MSHCRLPVRFLMLCLAMFALALSGCTGGAAPAGSDAAPPPVAGAGDSDVAPTPPPAAADDPAPPAEEPAPPMPDVTIEFIGGPVVAVDAADADRKLVMLTYDDGPHPGTTERVLDALKEAGVKAVFFVTGYGARHEDLLQRIHAEGHTLGTHTMTHNNLRAMSKEEQRAEIVGVNEIVERVTGQKVKYFRPPFGAYNEDTLALMAEYDLTLVNWTHGSRDWEPDVTHEDAAAVTAKVLAEEPQDEGDTVLRPGAVVLLHDTHSWTAEATPDFIAGLKEKGYEFVVLR